MAPTTASAYSGSPADSSAPGRSTATASWPRACSSGTTRCQYHAAPPAPGMRTNMLTKALRFCDATVYNGLGNPGSPVGVPGPLISRHAGRRVPCSVLVLPLGPWRSSRPCCWPSSGTASTGPSRSPRGSGTGPQRVWSSPGRHEQRHGLPASSVLHVLGRPFADDARDHAEPDDKQHADGEPEREQHHRPRPADDAAQLESDQRQLQDVEPVATPEAPANRHPPATHAPA